MFHTPHRKEYFAIATHIIDGKDIARKIRAELTQEIERLKAERSITPGLAFDRSLRRIGTGK